MSVEIDWRQMREWKGREKCAGAAKRSWTCEAMAAVDQLRKELDAMKVRDALIETDHESSAYGIGGRPRIAERARTSRIQVWFKIADEPRCLPCWTYQTWPENLKAIAMTLEMQRRERDYGVVTVEHQFASFKALPPPEPAAKIKPGSRWSTVEDAARFLIGVSIAPKSPSEMDVAILIKNPTVLSAWWKDASKKAHPDAGGSNEQMSLVNTARDFIVAQTGGG